MSAPLHDTDLVKAAPARDAWTAPIWPVVDRLSYQNPQFADIADQLHPRLAKPWA